MLTAVLVGLLASSALVIGTLTGAFWSPPKHLVAAALAFASGALITAFAFDLFREAFKDSGAWLAGTGVLAGATIFVIADAPLERYSSSSSGFALVTGVTLDGILENIALGISLIGSSITGVISLLAAIFVSNLPEALGGTVDMREGGGYSKKFAIGIWMATAVLLAAAVVIGYTIFSSLSKEALGIARAFAGGAVLASLADTLMPDAYREGGPLVALATVAGFLFAFMLTQG